ncbi:MAG: beta-ketoacyl synthase N-terminal-like domain-containing protein [Rickettsiaceae bacterium]
MRDISKDIAVIGMSAKLSGEKDINTWWNDIAQGRILTHKYSNAELKENYVPESHYLRNDYIPIRGNLDDILRFDNMLFGVNNRDAEVMDPQYRLMLESSWSALEDAGYGKKSTRPITGVFASTSTSNYMYNLLYNGPYEPDILEQIIHGNEQDFMASLISYKLNLTGPAVAIQTACSSSLGGLHLARQSLINKECDLALVVAAAIPFPQGGYIYQDGGIYSKSGKCRPFDAKADGVLEGSGVACVVLKRLEDIQKHDVEPHAVILGSSINNDGSAKAGYFAPSITGQTNVIINAVENACIDVTKISHIEMHGTGTIIGDPIEWSSTSEAYKKLGAKTHQIAIGSVKANIGHLDAAAGLASLIKTMMILKTSHIPKLANFESPNPYLSEYNNSPLYIPNDLNNKQEIEIACINSFGIGGTNAHVIVGKAPLNTLTKTYKSVITEPKLYGLSFSANDTDSLERLRQSMVEYLINNDPDLNDLIYTIREGKEHLKKNLTVCGHNKKEIIKKLKTKTSLFYNDTVNPTSCNIIFLFPGQGTQYPGMALPFVTIPNFKENIELCLKLCDTDIQETIRSALFDISFPENKLNQTELAQPSLFILEYSIAKCLIDLGITPSFLLGHSLGEFTSMCISEILTLEDAIKLVLVRGQAMQKCSEGLMLHLDCEKEELEKMIIDSNIDVSIAALNTEKASVISGTTSQIKQFLKFTGNTKFTKILKSNRPFHSELMRMALPSMDSLLNKISISTAKTPIILNLDGKILNTEKKINAEYFLKHAVSTVQFKKSLDQLAKLPNVFCIEIGPGKVLGSMAKAHNLNTISLLCDGINTTTNDINQQLILLNSIGLPISLPNTKKGKMLHIPTYQFYGPKWIASEISSNLSDQKKNKDLEIIDDIEAENKNASTITNRLIDIWISILRNNSIYENSDFFLSGGDSLTIITLVRKVNQEFGINLTAREILAAQLLKDQVSIIEKTLNLL